MPEKGRPPQAIPSPISRHIITCYVRYQGSKYTVIYIYIYIYIYISYIYIIYIYTLVQTIISVQAKLQVARRKHIVHPTGFGAMMYKHLSKHILYTVKPRSHRTPRLNHVQEVMKSRGRGRKWYVWSILAWPCFVTGYGRQRLFHGWSTALALPKHGKIYLSVISR